MQIKIKLTPPHMLGFYDKIVKSTDKISILSDDTLNFYYDGQEINPDSTFQELGINNEDIIQTKLKNEPLYMLQIYFSLPSGNKETFHVQSVWTFNKMARMIKQKCNITSDNIKFIHAGRVLNPKRAFCNESTLQTQSTIHVLV